MSVDNWLFSINQYLKACGQDLSDQVKVDFAAAQLRGPANIWWRTVQERAARDPAQGISTWATFSEKLHGQFKPINTRRVARDKLARLTQTKSVAEFAHQLRILSLDIPGITEEEQLDRFIRGCRPAISMELEFKEPATLEEAIRLAERMDEVRYRTSRFHHDHYVPWPASRQEEPTPMELGSMSQFAPRGNQPSRSTGFHHPPRTRLTAEERQKLWDENRCFKCRRTGHVALACPENQPRSQGNWYRQ